MEKGKLVSLDEKKYIILEQIQFEENTYYLVDEIDEKLKPCAEFCFLVATAEEEFELIEDEELKSILATLFSPYFQ